VACFEKTETTLCCNVGLLSLVITAKFLHHLPECPMTFLQFDEDVDSMLNALKEQTSLGPGQERQIIWLLWHQRFQLLRQQTQFEVIVSSVNLPAASNKDLLNKLLVC